MKVIRSGRADDGRNKLRPYVPTAFRSLQTVGARFIAPVTKFIVLMNSPSFSQMCPGSAARVRSSSATFVAMPANCRDDRKRREKMITFREFARVMVEAARMNAHRQL